MTSVASRNSTLAFIGATGGCAGYTLASALNAGYNCRALARSPEKLRESLTTKDVATSTIERHLVIIKGDGKDVESLRKTFQIPGGGLVDKIFSGIGAYPVAQWSLTHPLVLSDPSICADAAAAVVEAARQSVIQNGITDPSHLPLFVSFSTTGIEPKGCPRDVPLLYVPLYKWLLHSPHVDKHNMEKMLRSHSQETDATSGGTRGIRGVVLVKSTLLLEGKGKGIDSVRAGSEMQPAIGYTIERQDVGLWTFENLVRREPRGEWLTQAVTLTS